MFIGAGVGEFLSGLALGLVLGLLVGPLLRFWLTWHEWAAASREARLTERVLERMEAGPRGVLRNRRAASAPRPESRHDPS